MTSPNTDDWIDDLFGAVRDTCDDCEHPRCLDTLKAGRKLILAKFAEIEREARLDTIDKVFELSPKGSFANWKPMDAWHFYERLKDYEKQVKATLTKKEGQ
jgi:hypothetical protein